MSAPSEAVAERPADLGSPTTLILVRHGHTDLTGRVLSGGDGPGPSLNASGEQVADLVARVLADLPADAGPDALNRPTAVVTSPALRARETADLIAAALGLQPDVDDDWNEARAGDWNERTIAQIAQEWPQDYQAWGAFSDTIPPNGESTDQLALRVAMAADRVVSAHHGQTIAVVTHAGPIRALLSAALSADPIAARRLRLNPGSISVLRLWADGGCEVSAVNAGV